MDRLDKLITERKQHMNIIKFEDLPDDYVCPLCGVSKDLFDKQ